MSSFYNHFNWITQAKNLTPSEKNLSFALLKHLNSEDTCWPSKRLLAEETGLSTRHIRRLVISLVEKGVLQCTHRTGKKDNRNTSNLYTFRLPSPPPERDRDRGQEVLHNGQRKAVDSRQPVRCTTDRMTDSGGLGVRYTEDRAAARGRRDVTGGVTCRHTELKELELKELELKNWNTKGERGMVGSPGANPSHVQSPRQTPQNEHPKRAFAPPETDIRQERGQARYPRNFLEGVARKPWEDVLKRLELNGSKEPGR